MIRELREEVEKLRRLIGGGSGGGGGSSAPVNTKEIQELQDRLLISEGLMTEMSKTWEQRLAETERIHHERQQTLENMGISVQEAGIGVQVNKFYMVNLNADPSMNELLVCYLKVQSYKPIPFPPESTPPTHYPLHTTISVRCRCSRVVLYLPFRL